MLTIKQAVRNGIDLLNISIPRWVDILDLDSLNIQSSDNCIIGQVFADTNHSFDTAIIEMGLLYEDNEYANYGFSCPNELCTAIGDRSGGDKELRDKEFAVFFGELTAEWKRAILEIKDGEGQNNQSADKESLVADQQIESKSSALV